MTESVWTVAEAKAKFSELVSKAQSSGPQSVTRNGRPAVVVVSAEQWERKSHRNGTLTAFLAASPLHGSALDIERRKDPPRDIDL